MTVESRRRMAQWRDARRRQTAALRPSHGGCGSGPRGHGRRRRGLHRVPALLRFPPGALLDHRLAVRAEQAEGLHRREYLESAVRAHADLRRAAGRRLAPTRRFPSADAADCKNNGPVGVRARHSHWQRDDRGDARRGALDDTSLQASPPGSSPGESCVATRCIERRSVEHCCPRAERWWTSAAVVG